uniref:Putative ovule protein n=1 Tax=Solanum chacoense TaxID=4108 RepID=A0A0V0ILL7_SOLCH
MLTGFAISLVGAVCARVAVVCCLYWRLLSDLSPELLPRASVLPERQVAGFVLIAAAGAAASGGGLLVVLASCWFSPGCSLLLLLSPFLPAA